LIRSSWPGLLETGVLSAGLWAPRSPIYLADSSLLAWALGASGRSPRLRAWPGRKTEETTRTRVRDFFISGELEDEVEEARRRRSGDSAKGSPFVACEYPVRP